MPRLEDLTEGPSGSENYEIPHPCALQNTATGEESEIASAYKELLVYLEWKNNLTIQNQMEKSGQFRERCHAGSWVESTHD